MLCCRNCACKRGYCSISLLRTMDGLPGVSRSVEWERDESPAAICAQLQSDESKIIKRVHAQPDFRPKLQAKALSSCKLQVRKVSTLTRIGPLRLKLRTEGLPPQPTGNVAGVYKDLLGAFREASGSVPGAHKDRSGNPLESPQDLTGNVSRAHRERPIL